jgi:hypothetical protein
MVPRKLGLAVNVKALRSLYEHADTSADMTASTSLPDAYEAEVTSERRPRGSGRHLGPQSATGTHSRSSAGGAARNAAARSRMADFFREEEQPGRDLIGVDPWTRVKTVLDTGLIDQLRAGPLESAGDVDAAYALAQLAHEELVAYGTGGGERLSDDEMAGVLRCLRSVLKRNHLDFDPPFRDFRGFHGYWSSQAPARPLRRRAARQRLPDLRR